VHDCFAVALPECAIEASAVVMRQVVPYKGLSAIFVYALKNLALSTNATFQSRLESYFVGRSVTESGEEGEKSGGYRARRCVSEDNLV
jgi:hypothetical protein